MPWSTVVPAVGYAAELIKTTLTIAHPADLSGYWNTAARPIAAGSTACEWLPCWRYSETRWKCRSCVLGMTTGGLSATDLRDPRILGGVALDFYSRYQALPSMTH